MTTKAKIAASKAARGRNTNSLAGRRGGAALEDPAAPTPSRKSTRKSSDRTKRTTNQQLKAVRKTTSPSARAQRNQAARKATGGVKAPTRGARR